MTGRISIETRFNAEAPAHWAWEAWWSNEPDGSPHVGYGRTQTDAVHDLWRLEVERWEAEHPEDEDAPWDTDAP